MCNIGRVLYGYCGGIFGESYGDKRIESEGVDWIVARKLSEEAFPEFALFDNEEQKKALIKELSVKEEE